MASEKVINLTLENFEEEVENSTLPVLVDFWAAWCGPCKMIAPIIDQLADEFDGKVKIAKVNVDENRDLSIRFQVASIPTLLLFKDGEVVNQMIGARPKAELTKLLHNA
ncbi:MAG TPA: thioredoxin [Clostridiales bacterium]|nr:thioredoxin [Clostridia bacterium]HCS73892.1 thioredoxin [Clostridiales bacterium]